MLWYQCLISMNFYLPTKLQRNRRFHTTSVAVRGYRRPRVCHGWRKLCLLVLDTVSLKKIAFICQAWFQKYLSLFWKNTRSFDSGWTILIFAMKIRIWLDSRCSFFPFDPHFSPHHPWAYPGRHVHSTTSPYPGLGTKCERLHKQLPKTCHFRRLFTKRGAHLHLLEQNILADIHARWHSLPAWEMLK